jgi:hypothetical protein
LAFVDLAHVEDVGQLAASDPHVAAAIALLEANGKWETSPPGDASLAHPVTEALKAGASADLVKNLLFQIAFPENMTAVAPRVSRAATAAQALLANENPGRYFSLAIELTGSGATKMASGQVLRIRAEDLRWLEQEGRGRDLCWRLNATIQAAFMWFGSSGSAGLGGEHLALADWRSSRPSLVLGQFNRLTNALLGRSVFADEFERMSPADVQEISDLGGVPPTVSEQRARWVQELRARLQVMSNRHPEGFWLVMREGDATALTIEVTGVSPDGQEVVLQDPRSGLDVKLSLNDLSYKVSIPPIISSASPAPEPEYALAGSRRRP